MEQMKMNDDQSRTLCFTNINKEELVNIHDVDRSEFSSNVQYVKALGMPYRCGAVGVHLEFASHTTTLQSLMLGILVRKKQV